MNRSVTPRDLLALMIAATVVWAVFLLVAMLWHGFYGLSAVAAVSIVFAGTVIAVSMMAFGAWLALSM